MHLTVLLTEADALCSPEVRGCVPSFRFRHSTVLAKPAPGSLLHLRVAAALGGPIDREGHLLLMYAGYDTRSTEFGGAEIAVRAPWPAHSSCISTGAIEAMLSVTELQRAGMQPFNRPNNSGQALQVPALRLMCVCHEQGLWVHPDGRTITWMPLKSTGPAPCPRHHHTAELFDSAPLCPPFPCCLQCHRHHQSKGHCCPASTSLPVS